ncbi:hypothetical protein [Erythrobacter sp.]|uniref:hypothetical protein n=1 Tax=Erythrobacter sp. TaxID=1042 RepID=UPI00311DAB27
MNDASALSNAIRSAAEASGSILVATSIYSGDNATAPVAFLEADNAVRILAAHSPRIIYLLEQVFNLGDELEAALAEYDIELLPGDLKALRGRFSKYDGQIGATVASFMVDGMLHTVFASASWQDEFSDLVKAIVEDGRERARAGQFSKQSEEARAIERKALILLRHTSFNHGRVSFDKRMTLAETLFQDCDQHALAAITRRAENLFWLEQSGVTIKEADH